MDCTRAGTVFSPKNTAFYAWLHCIKKVLLETWAPNCEIIPVKLLFFKSQKITATGYYAIEIPLPDWISVLAACWLSSATGSQNG